MSNGLKVGQVLAGFCNIYFRGDCYEDKRVEAVGHDWVVVRTLAGEVLFASSENGEPIEESVKGKRNQTKNHRK